MTKNILLCFIHFLFFTFIDYAVSQDKIGDIKPSSSSDNMITYIVRYKSDTDLTKAKSVFSDKKVFDKAYSFKKAPIDIIKVKSKNIVEFEEYMAKANNILYYEKDSVKKIFYHIPNDPLVYDQWYIDYMNAPLLWGKLIDIKQDHDSFGQELVIAIIDTGVDLEHPELKESFWTNRFEIPGNNIDDDFNGYVDDIHGINSACEGCDTQRVDATECSNHGTLMAGIIAAKQDNNVGISGLTPNVKILICKAGTDYGMQNSAVFKAMDYIIEMKSRGVNIIAVNMSYGGDEKSNIERYLLDEFEKYDIIPIIAAGNLDQNLDKEPLYPASFKLDHAIVVGSVNANSEKSEFSNFGRRTVEIFAPGESILTTAYIYGEHGYAMVEGTSISTPMIASAIAYEYMKHPSYSIYDIKEQVISMGQYSRELDRISVSGKILNFSE